MGASLVPTKTRDVSRAQSGRRVKPKKASVSRRKRGKGLGVDMYGGVPWACCMGRAPPQARAFRSAPAVSRPGCPRGSRHCWQRPGHRPREQDPRLRLPSASPLFLPLFYTPKRVLSVTCAGTGHQHGLQTSHFKLFIGFHHSPK